jgi:hypothetical protein
MAVISTAQRNRVASPGPANWIPDRSLDSTSDLGTSSWKLLDRISASDDPPGHGHGHTIVTPKGVSLHLRHNDPPNPDTNYHIRLPTITTSEPQTISIPAQSTVPLIIAATAFISFFVFFFFMRMFFMLRAYIVHERRKKSRRMRDTESEEHLVCDLRNIVVDV